MLGHAGSVSLEAIRWLADLGIGFAQIDLDARILLSSNGGSENARLRRAQALAATSPYGVEIARWLLDKKLAGQERVLPTLQATPELELSFAQARERLTQAPTINELVMAERDAALAYWSAWASIPIRFARSDARRVPTHWTVFGTRGSPLSSGPRLAVAPGNALLNYVYAILEAETRLACLALGLDPSLPIVHGDRFNGFVFDLMEPVRPEVDAYVLELLQKRTFACSDFYETRRGNCRLLAPTTHTLAETAPAWGRLVAPIVEEVARMLSDSADRNIKVPTPLTGAHRIAGHEQVRRRRSPRQSKRPAVANEMRCARCGATPPHADRRYCDECLPLVQAEQYVRFERSGLLALERMKAEAGDPTHRGEAAKRRATTTSRRKAEIREWEARYGRLTDLSAFEREILPRIQGVPLRQLAAATGLSLRYVSQIRRGQKRPHPKHWAALAGVTESSA